MNKQEANEFLEELVLIIKDSDEKEKFDAKPMLFFIKDSEYIPTCPGCEKFIRYILKDDTDLYFDTYDELMEFLNNQDDSESIYTERCFEEIPMIEIEFFHPLSFLTRESCQEHIDKNIYNYNKPIAYSRYVNRNPLMEKLFKSLIVLFGINK